MKIIAVIPVKSESKRIISKNTKLLTDRPLFIHTLDKLLENNELDKIIVDIPGVIPQCSTPSMLPSKITFVNSTCNDSGLVSPQFSWRPQVGDFFIFPAQQSHFVYPFRTADGKGERRSVSFNAIFATEDEIKAQQEQQKQLL